MSIEIRNPASQFESARIRLGSIFSGVGRFITGHEAMVISGEWYHEASRGDFINSLNEIALRVTQDRLGTSICTANTAFFQSNAETRRALLSAAGQPAIIVQEGTKVNIVKAVKLGLPGLHKTEVFVPTDGRYYDVVASPINDATRSTVLVRAFDVTESRLREQALERKNEQQADFYAATMHALKNGLTAPYGRAQMLARLTNSDPRLAAAAELISSNLRGVIDKATRFPDQLEIAERLRKEPMDIIAMVRNIATERVEIARGEKAGMEKLELIVDPSVPAQEIIGDPEKLDEAVTNLIVNAIQAMRDCPIQRLEIKYEYLGDDICVRVKDTGIGIPFTDPAEAFDKRKTSKENGNGVGLYDTRNIVEAHQGKIEISETSPSGTTITVRLPLQKKKHSLVA